MPSDEGIDWVAALLSRLMTGEPLMPWPEAPQDVAMIAFFIDQLCGQRAAALELALDMHDVIHAACHRSGATWGSVAECVADRIRSALGATDE